MFLLVRNHRRSAIASAAMGQTVATVPSSQARPRPSRLAWLVPRSAHLLVSVITASRMSTWAGRARGIPERGAQLATRLIAGGAVIKRNFHPGSQMLLQTQRLHRIVRAGISVRLPRSRSGVPLEGATPVETQTFPDPATRQIVTAVESTGLLTPDAQFMLRQTVDALLAGTLAGTELASYVAHDNIDGLRAALARHGNGCYAHTVSSAPASRRTAPSTHK